MAGARSSSYSASKTKISASAAQTTKTQSTNKRTTSKKKAKKTEAVEKQQNTSIDAQQKLGPSPSSSPAKRTKSPGVRVVHGRIYDSENGKCCHQCRQKTRDFSVQCKNQKGDKQCSFYFCHLCLLNRYGEKAEEMAVLGDWKCPKCRGICNCSQCMKKRGCIPTGNLLCAAKASGFASVSELLQSKDFKQEGIATLTGKHGKENGSNGKNCSKSKRKPNSHDEEEENSETKSVRKNDDSKTETRKLSKSAAASSKKLASSKKFQQDLAIASSIGRKRVRNSDGDSDTKLSSKMIEIEKERKNCKLKKLRKDGRSGNSVEGNVDNAAFKEIIKLKKSQISKGKFFIDENVCSMDDGGQLKKRKSDKGPEEICKRKNKIEDNEAIIIISSEEEGEQFDQFGKHQNETPEVQGNHYDVKMSLPQGIELTKVANIDLPAEDIGNALQFLEFCEAFGKVLDIKKGQPECILRELVSGQCSNWIQSSSIVQFHIKLLSVIENNLGKEYESLETECTSSWQQTLSRYISDSKYRPKELLLDQNDLECEGYGELSSSKKLRLLTFLCDEALGSVELRSWMDEKNLEYVEEEKKVKGKERKKEKYMKMKLQNELAKAVLLNSGAPLSVSEHQDLVSKIKAEAAQTLADTLDTEEVVIKMMGKGNRKSDAVRSEPMLLDGNGRKFWKLSGHFAERVILLQDLANGDSVTFKENVKEKWFSYNVEEGAILKYLLGQLKK